jgi:hypothetical protein
MPALAQDVVVDNFESYGGSGDVQIKWTVNGNAEENAFLGTDGGADSTPNYLIYQDGGFSFAGSGVDLVSPAAGNYKLSFYYKNGLDALPFAGGTVSLIQDGNSKFTFNIPNAAQSTWTFHETGTLALSGSPVTIRVTAANGGANFYKAGFDQFILTPVANAPLALNVWPDDRIYLSRTETITATPEFGSGTYTKIEMDVNNDGTVDLTDSSAPFQFTWDTLAAVAQGTSRTLDAGSGNTPLAVKFTVTDSLNGSASTIENYTVDNRFDGRESMIINGDFSQWQPANGAITLPVGWNENWTTSTAPEIGPAPGRDTAAGDCLRIKFGATIDPIYGNNDRYAIHTNGKTGNYHDLQTYDWGKGTYCRLYYMVSHDGGATFATSLQSAGEVNSTTWTFAIETTVQNGLGLNDTSQVALGTHQLGTTEHFWDDVVSEGIKYPASSSVGEWKLY